MTIPNNSWRDLGQIQRWMQAAITHPVGVAEGIASAEARRHIDVGPDEAETVVTRSRALTALERLAIYGYAYYARLLECLRDAFPVLKHALGEELFDAFAAEYLQQYPSRSYTLLQLGVNFPRFLAETRPQQEGVEDSAADWPDFLIDLATLEWTFNEVFDGPGVEGEQLLDAGQLRAIPPERLLEARLECVPCLRLLALRYPVHKYVTGVRRHEEPEPPEPAETCLARAGATWSATTNSRGPPTNSCTPCSPASQWARRSVGRSRRPARTPTAWPTTCGRGSTTGLPSDSSAPWNLRIEGRVW
jgi:Putative DNA-binding domain